MISGRCDCVSGGRCDCVSGGGCDCVSDGGCDCVSGGCDSVRCDCVIGGRCEGEGCPDGAESVCDEGQVVPASIATAKEFKRSTAEEGAVGEDSNTVP